MEGFKVEVKATKGADYTSKCHLSYPSMGRLIQLKLSAEEMAT
jgi:hypothetical protein